MKERQFDQDILFEFLPEEDNSDKKYTEEDMLNAINYCSSLTPSNSKLSPLERAVYAHNYIKSINKQR